MFPLKACALNLVHFNLVQRFHFIKCWEPFSFLMPSWLHEEHTNLSNWIFDMKFRKFAIFEFLYYAVLSNYTLTVSEYVFCLLSLSEWQKRRASPKTKKSFEKVEIRRSSRARNLVPSYSDQVRNLFVIWC